MQSNQRSIDVDQRLWRIEANVAKLPELLRESTD
jgi:hypothetical protein